MPGGVEEVKKWPFNRILRYMAATTKYYEMQTGEMEKVASSSQSHLYQFKELD